MNIGEKIRYYRQKSGLNQEKLAKKSGISRSALTNYEKGNRNPTVETISLIAKALNISVSELVDESLEVTKGLMMSKEEQDQYILSIIKNLVMDQTAFNINRWGSMKNFFETFGLAHEELVEFFKEMKWFSGHRHEFFEMVMRNDSTEDINYQLGITIEYGIRMIQELIHVLAVYQRTIDTVENAPAADQSKTDADKK